MSTLQAHKTGGYRVDAEGAAGGQLIPLQDARALTKHQNGTGVGAAGDPSYTLDRTGSQGVGVRRLTPVECERLMSWPDDWTAVDGDDTPDSRRYAACGDGVVSNVSEWLARGMLREDAA